MTKALARFAVVLVAVTVVGGWIFGLVFRGPGDRSAVWLSATVAVVLQAAAFVISRAAGQAGLTARMGAGALVRFLGLVGYALLVALVVRVPPAAALVSLASFLFVTSLLEPLLIRS